MKRPSMTDVARRSGVSVATVSHVVNGTRAVSDATASRVREVIADLGYVPNAVARQLKTGVGEAVGLVVHELGNPYFADLAKGAEHRLMSEGGSLIVGSTNSEATVEERLLRRLFSQSIRGMILTPSASTESNLRRIGHPDCHVVLMTDVCGDLGCSTVGLDDTLGGELAVRHLIHEGRRRILMINGLHGLRHCEARWKGAQRAASMVDGVSLDVVWDDGSVQPMGVRLALRPGELRRFDGIFCVNDMTALTVLRTLRDIGVRVPDDIAVVGYDDLDFASELMTPLTTVRQPTYDMGRTAMEVLLSGTVQHINFVPELVIRDSA